MAGGSHPAHRNGWGSAPRHATSGLCDEPAGTAESAALPIAMLHQQPSVRRMPVVRILLFRLFE